MRFPWIFSHAGIIKGFTIGVWGKHPDFGDFLNITPGNIETPSFVGYFQKGAFKVSDNERGWFFNLKKKKLEMSFFRKSCDSQRRACPLIIYATGIIEGNNIEIWSLFYTLSEFFKVLEDISYSKYENIQQLKEKTRPNINLKIKRPDFSQTKIAMYILKIKRGLSKEKERWIADKSIVLKIKKEMVIEESTLFLRAMLMYIGIDPWGMILWFTRDEVFLKILFRDARPHDFSRG